jgi:arsenite oxidase small subunit
MSRRDFVLRFGTGVVVGAVGVAAAESLLKSGSEAGTVTSTVAGPTTTAAGPTTTMTGTTTVTATTTVPGPTTTETSTETTTETSSAAASGFPTLKVANVSDVTANTPISFNYPLADEPNILVKLGQTAQGGVGPDSDIVAFSMICQHEGCNPAYHVTDPYGQSAGPVAVCPCHDSVYDLVNRGAVLSGPAPLPIPQVLLSIDANGDIYAYAISLPVIYGHGSGDDINADLQG